MIVIDNSHEQEVNNAILPSYLHQTELILLCECHLLNQNNTGTKPFPGGLPLLTIDH